MGAADDLFKKGVSVANDLFMLKVSKDRLEAVISAVDSKIGASLEDLDVVVLINEIKGHGITFGNLNPPVIKAPGVYCVARGRAAVHGENAKIKAYVKPVVVRSPKIKKKDQVDYRELGSIVNVAKDKLLLEKILPTPGSPGKSVTGDIINPKSGKDITVKVGPGALLSDDGVKVFSQIEGKYVLADGKASVMSEHTVLADVDLSTGNLAFVGEFLSINGSVLPGFKVKCRGGIYIAQGVQNAAVITAGGDLEIKGGGIGEDIVLKCWGNIKVDFLEGVGKIEVKGNLQVADTLIQCNARVGGSIHATSGKGTLIGGVFTVGGSVYVKELGSDAEVQTSVTVGVNPELEEKKRELEREQEIWPAKMTDILKNTTALKKLKDESGGELPSDKALLLKKFNEMMPQVMDKVNDLTEREQALEEEFAQAVNESVYVYGSVYPGCTISIGGMSRTLTAQEDWVVIHFDKATRQIHCRSMTPEERVAVEG